MKGFTFLAIAAVALIALSGCKGVSAVLNPDGSAAGSFVPPAPAATPAPPISPAPAPKNY